MKNWFSNHRPSKRRLIQLYVALLYNANIRGFVTGKISTSGSKNMCVPGFNCYSCPGAVGACPLGSLQNALGGSKTSTIAYVFGIIILFGLICGRTICGFLCPMGLLQDLIYKIKSPKLKKSRFTKILSYFKYVLLLVFVIIIPLAYSNVIVLPAFCQYICPVGLLAGLFYLPNNTAELESLGVLFTWKFSLAVAILIGAVFVYRLFCRFFCPLGALYGFFSRLALLGVKLDKDKCTACGLCIKTCKVDITRVGDHECIQCGACVSVCPTNAISWKGGRLFVLPNQIEQPVSIEKVDLTAMADGNLPDEPTVTVEQEVQGVAKTDVKTATPPLYALRKNNGKGFKLIALILALMVLMSSLIYFNFISKETVASTSYRVGDVMENFEAREYFSSDGTYALEEDRGKIVVLNFWYITCGGCEAEMPHFGKLANDSNYTDKVSVVVVHADDSDNIYEADKQVDYNGGKVPYIEKYILSDKGWGEFNGNIKWIMDLADENSIYLSLGGTSAYPITAIIDGEGVIRFITLASVTEEKLYSEVNKILAE